MPLETKRVLVVVKAYPNPSKKYEETVCCAGIDLKTGQWIRLYPIPFRDLDESKKFSKYTIIDVQCEKAIRDRRIESYRVNSDSIRIIKTLDTSQGWRKRKQILLPTVSQSFCHILSEVKQNRSLGMFKPIEVSFSVQKADAFNSVKRHACYTQLSFFNKQKKEIEKIPYDFYYHFKCQNEPDCPGHQLKIIDWEIGQAYRAWRKICPTQENLLLKLREKWLYIVSSSKDAYFIVGNLHFPRKQFMILGVFYPPITHKRLDEMGSLF